MANTSATWQQAAHIPPANSGLYYSMIEILGSSLFLQSVLAKTTHKNYKDYS